jgi:hypothetical protein
MQYRRIATSVEEPAMSRSELKAAVETAIAKEAERARGEREARVAREAREDAKLASDLEAVVDWDAFRRRLAAELDAHTQRGSMMEHTEIELPSRDTGQVDVAFAWPFRWQGVCDWLTTYSHDPVAAILVDATRRMGVRRVERVFSSSVLANSCEHVVLRSCYTSTTCPVSHHTEMSSVVWKTSTDGWRKTLHAAADVGIRAEYRYRAANPLHESDTVMADVVAAEHARALAVETSFAENPDRDWAARIVSIEANTDRDWASRVMSAEASLQATIDRDWPSRVMSVEASLTSEHCPPLEASGASEVVAGDAAEASLTTIAPM